MILLKSGWKYNKCDGIVGDLLVTVKDHFSSPQAPIFHNEPRRGGSCVIPENVKKDLIGFPSEIIYSLWSVLQHGITKEPLPFHDAYVHIPIDFNNRTNQLMLVYTLISVLLKEKNGNYTKGKIGFKEVDE